MHVVKLKCTLHESKIRRKILIDYESFKSGELKNIYIFCTPLYRTEMNSWEKGLTPKTFTS